MDGSMVHTPAEIVQQLLVDLGLATIGGAWAVYENSLPDDPDNAIAVDDVEGRLQGRTQVDGRMQGVHGLSIVVRGVDQRTARTRANLIATALDETVNQNLVTISSNSYRVHAISRTSDTMSLGKDGTNSRRRLFSINAVASIKAV